MIGESVLLTRDGVTDSGVGGLWWKSTQVNIYTLSNGEVSKEAGYVFSRKQRFSNVPSRQMGISGAVEGHDDSINGIGTSGTVIIWRPVNESYPTFLGDIFYSDFKASSFKVEGMKK